MRTALTIVYLACFQAAAAPAIARVLKRRSSADCSLWREGLLLAGVSAQFAVMRLTGADWRVFISPLASGTSILVLAGVVWYYRRPITSRR